MLSPENPARLWLWLSLIYRAVRNGISWVNKKPVQMALFFFLPLRPAVIVKMARLLPKCCFSFVTLRPRSESRRGEAHGSKNSLTPLLLGLLHVCVCVCGEVVRDKLISGSVMKMAGVLIKHLKGSISILILHNVIVLNPCFFKNQMYASDE